MTSSSTVICVQSLLAIASRATAVTGMTTEKVVAGLRTPNRTRDVSAIVRQPARTLARSMTIAAAVAQRTGNIARTAALTAIQVAARMARREGWFDVPRLRLIQARRLATPTRTAEGRTAETIGVTSTATGTMGLTETGLSRRAELMLLRGAEVLASASTSRAEASAARSATDVTATTVTSTEAASTAGAAAAATHAVASATSVKAATSPSTGTEASTPTASHAVTATATVTSASVTTPTMAASPPSAVATASATSTTASGWQI